MNMASAHLELSKCDKLLKIKITLIELINGYKVRLINFVEKSANKIIFVSLSKYKIK